LKRGLIFILSLIVSLSLLVSSVSAQDAGRTLVVTSAADDGPGTLRQALFEAQPGDTITFDPVVFPLDAPTTIAVRSSLPPLHQGGVTIDASDAGVILDGDAAPDAQLDNALMITSDGNVIRGLQILNFPSMGLWIGEGASENVIGGRNPTPGVACTGACNLISGNRRDGVYIAGLGTEHNTVAGNFIGTDATGTMALGNSCGVTILEGAQHNHVGGVLPGEGNLISGNVWDGVMIDGQGTGHNLVRGNTIGTNAAGTAAIPNGNMGVNLGGGAQYNQIGGSSVAERNLISGNGNIGMHLAGEGVKYNVVLGNYIGTDMTGQLALGNRMYGVSFGELAQQNRLGGELPGEGNLISGNGDGVNFDSPGTQDNTVLGNWIGTDATGKGALGNTGYGVIIVYGPGPNVIGPGNVIAYNGLAGVSVQNPDTRGNTITGNAIYDNGGPGIEQVEGGNAELPAPEVLRVGLNVVQGTTVAGATVEVFSGEEGAGRILEGSTVADDAGKFTFRVPAGRFTGPQVLLTATDAEGNTSPFSSPEAPRLTRGLPGTIDPTQVSLDPAVAGTNLGLALFCVFFFGFTSNVFNGILEDYRDELVRAFERFVPRRLAQGFNKAESALGGMLQKGRGGFLLVWLLVLLGTSLIESFLDGEVASFGPERLGLVFTLFVSAVLVSALEWGADLYAYRRWMPTLEIESKVQWVGMLIAVVCVIVSRVLEFQPGYLYGIVGTLYLLPEISGVVKAGKRALFVLGLTFLGGLALWIATAFLPGALGELEPIFMTVFLLSLQGVFFQLFPLALNDGSDIWSWKRGIWLGFFVLVAFCFHHFVLNPNGSEVQALQQNGVQTLLLLIGIFGGATLALWLLFPFRLGRQEAQGA